MSDVTEAPRTSLAAVVDKFRWELLNNLIMHIGRMQMEPEYDGRGELSDTRLGYRAAYVDGYNNALLAVGRVLMLLRGEKS